MASIRKVKGRYYSRVQWWDESGKRKSKTIALITDKKSESVVRNNEVEKVEDTIKRGVNWSFAWMHEGGKVNLIRRTFQMANRDMRIVWINNGVFRILRKQVLSVCHQILIHRCVLCD